MIEDIEGVTGNGMRLEIAKENLEYFGELVPTNSILTVNLADYKDRAIFPFDYICSGLKDSLGTQSIQGIDISSSSVILYDDNGIKGLFIVDQFSKEKIWMGLPESELTYYGVVWGNGEQPRIYSNFCKNSDHIMQEKDVSAIHSLYYTLAYFSLEITTDPITDKKTHELHGLESRA